MITELMVKDDDYCFACGCDNLQGLQMKVIKGDGTAETVINLKDEHQGWKGIAHGGIVSTILDEMMAHAIYTQKDGMVTVELKIRYKKAVPVGEDLVARGWIEEMGKRRVIAKSELRLKETDELLAIGESKFLLV